MFCGLGLRVVVEAGLNGDVEEGVRSAFRLVFIESSIRERDKRRKERSEEGEKQNCGLN